jgi:L-ribulokinase
MDAMTGVQPVTFTPDPARRAVYDRLYALYRRVHDAFGLPDGGETRPGDMYGAMKELLDIRDEVRHEPRRDDGALDGAEAAAATGAH